MKTRLIMFGVVMSLLASCTTEELGDELNNSEIEEISTKVQTENLDRNVSVFNPVIVPDGQLVEGEEISGSILDENGNVISATGRLPRFTRGLVLTVSPSITSNTINWYLPLDNGRFRFVGSNAFSTFYVGAPIANINRWHRINGEFFFLFAGIPNGRDALWLRFKSGSSNTGNMEVVRFRNSNAIVVDDLNNLDANFVRLIKQTVIVNSTGNPTDLGFFYINLEMALQQTIPVGYDSLPITIEAIPLGGATINNVELFINGQLIRRERFAPYEWGAANQRPSETLGLTNGGFFRSHTVKAVATDNEGRTAAIETTFFVGREGLVFFDN